MASTAPTTPDNRSSSQFTNSDNDLIPNSPQSSRPIRNICFIGAGYVGGPTAAVIAYQNPDIRVTVVNRDEGRIRRWNSKHLPIYEPGLKDIVRIARDGGRLFTINNTQSITASSEQGRFNNDQGSVSTIDVPARSPNLFFSVSIEECIGEADIVFIAVNTPTKSSGQGAGYATDMTALEAAVKEIALHARRGTIIVEKSTVPCGTAKLIQGIVANHRAGYHFKILSNPEFLSAGTAVKDLMYPDRVLIGCSPTPSGHRAAGALAGIYGGWVPQDRIIRMNVWSSELSKLVANSMLAQRISSINSISAIYEKTDAEIDEVATAVGCDPRIGNGFLKAGIGFGGSCFKKDIFSLIYLATSLGLEEVSEYWHQVIKMNDHQRERFCQRVVQCLNNTLTGKKITFLGYAFKANTSDTRGSLTLEIIKTLLNENPAEIAIFDSCCDTTNIREELKAVPLSSLDGPKEEDRCRLRVYSNVYEACTGSSVVLITTEYEYFGNSAVSSPGYEGEKYPDPRPFAGPRVTEMDILALHNFLLQSSSISAHGRGKADPLQRFRDEPSCPDGCTECEPVGPRGHSMSDLSSEFCGSKGSVDWPRIINSMKIPKWLFDGKGIIDPKEMAELNIRVESIGRQSRFWV